MPLVLPLRHADPAQIVIQIVRQQGQRLGREACISVKELQGFCQRTAAASLSAIHHYPGTDRVIQNWELVWSLCTGSSFQGGSCQKEKKRLKDRILYPAECWGSSGMGRKHEMMHNGFNARATCEANALEKWNMGLCHAHPSSVHPSIHPSEEPWITFAVPSVETEKIWLSSEEMLR